MKHGYETPNVEIDLFEEDAIRTSSVLDKLADFDDNGSWDGSW